MKSIERSLQFGLITSLLLLMLLFWWAASLATKLLSESLVYQRLEEEANVIRAALEFPDMALDAPRLNSAQLNPAYDMPFSGRYYLIRADSGDVIMSRSVWEHGLTIDSLAPGEQMRVRRRGAAEEPLLFWAGGFAAHGHQFTIGVAEDVSALTERLTIFRVYFAAITLLLLLTLLAVQHLVVRWSVRKLEAVRADMSRLEHGQTTALSEDVPSEILPLVREFNLLLMRFDQRLKQSRNAVGNLAHSLKGPLNLLLRASNDNAAGGGTGVNPQIGRNAEQIRQLIERELKRARLAGHSSAGRLFDVREEIPALAGLLKQVYSNKKIRFRIDIPDEIELLFDRQDMLELIGNLLDNAVKWAGSTVGFAVRTSQSNVFLTVEDDGPGCSAEELHRLTDRGVRLDESVAGHGLGLSIVKDVVDTYGGSIRFGRSVRLGGFLAQVQLPESAVTPVGVSLETG